MISSQRRDEIIDALRRGTVPERGLGELGVRLEKFQKAIDDELQSVAGGRSQFKAIRGEYGAGKTFFSRWIQEKARKSGFATAEVQISETETPLHRLETVYRRMMENLSTVDANRAAFRNIIDGWFFALEEDVLSAPNAGENEQELLARTNALMENKLAPITRSTPAFAAALRGYRQALAAGDNATAEGLIAWLCGQPHVASAAKRSAGIKGEVDHFGALSFLQALLLVLRDSGHPGLVIVLDEVETLQRVRSDVREKGLNALRQLIDEVDGGRFPGLYLLITGTRAFFEGPQGVQRLTPLAQRLHVDFETNSRFDNPRAPQVRLKGFDIESLVELGSKVRGIYVQGSERPDAICQAIDDSYIRKLADRITGELGGKVGIVPRIFLKKLVGDVLDRVDQFADFDPRKHYALTINDSELTKVERNAVSAGSVDEIELDL